MSWYNTLGWTALDPFGNIRTFYNVNTATRTYLDAAKDGLPDVNFQVGPDSNSLKTFGTGLSLAAIAVGGFLLYKLAK